MAAIFVALLAGGIATSLLLWPYGWVYMLIGAPLGASGFALIFSLIRMALTSSRAHSIKATGATKAGKQQCKQQCKGEVVER